ncbi:hypothetical protein RZS08_56345, partial [Arthrospira platensis SPKY1]|nr:hypothetical protein [Arthrospira platensis SPKY1]
MGCVSIWCKPRKARCKHGAMAVRPVIGVGDRCIVRAGLERSLFSVEKSGSVHAFRRACQPERRTALGADRVKVLRNHAAVPALQSRVFWC